MNYFHRLAEPRYLSWLALLLGASFQLSMAATNILFYLFIISGAVLTVTDFLQKTEAITQDWQRLCRSPLWLLVTLWAVLLYVSMTYNESHPLQWDYAKKYLKYLLLGFVVVIVLAQQRQGIDVPKRFFIGFAVGGAIVFGLGALNYLTGWLSLAANAGWIKQKYVVSGYWISNDLFAHSLFMAILFVYGLSGWLRTRSVSYLLFCFVGIFGVLVASSQRTGFVAVIVVSIWLAWLLLPSLKKKIGFLVIIVAVIALTLAMNNNIASRILFAVSEWQHCNAVISTQVDVQILGENCHNSIGLRLMFIRDSLAQIGDAWFLGHGLGNLNITTLNYDWHTKAYSIGRASNPHNEYLLQGIQLGVVGIMLLIGIFVTAFYQAIRLNRSRRYVYAGIVLMYIVGCLFNSFLLDTMQGLFFVLLIAFIIAEQHIQREQR